MARCRICVPGTVKQAGAHRNCALFRRAPQWWPLRGCQRRSERVRGAGAGVAQWCCKAAADVRAAERARDAPRFSPAQHRAHTHGRHAINGKSRGRLSVIANASPPSLTLLPPSHSSPKALPPHAPSLSLPRRRSPSAAEDITARSATCSVARAFASRCTSTCQRARRTGQVSV